jgi:hypothetical protein
MFPGFSAVGGIWTLTRPVLFLAGKQEAVFHKNIASQRSPKGHANATIRN